MNANPNIYTVSKRDDPEIRSMSRYSSIYRVSVPRISLQYSLGVADVPFHMTAVLFWDVIVVLSIFGYRNPGRSRAACWSQSTTTSHARAEYSKRYITFPNPNVLPAAGSRVRGLSGVMTNDIVIRCSICPICGSGIEIRLFLLESTCLTSNCTINSYQPTLNRASLTASRQLYAHSPFSI